MEELANIPELHERLTSLEREVLRLRSLIETTSDWVWEVDREGVYTYASPEIERLLGYAPDEVLGKSAFDFMLPDERTRVKSLFFQALASCLPITQVMNVNVHKDGRRVVLETSGVPIFDASGVLIGYRGIDRDVTARVRGELALKNSEQRFQELAESAPVGIFLGDAQGQITFVNQRWSDITGWSIQHGETLDWRVGIHAEDRDNVKREQEKLFHDSEEIAVEFRYATPTGVRKYLLLNMRTLAENGRSSGFIGTVLDLTERKLAEERVEHFLKCMEVWAAEMDATITAIADGVIIYAPDMTVVRSNRAADTMLEYSLDNPQQAFADCFAHLQVQSPEGETLSMDEQPGSRALRGETIHAMELSLLHADGRRQWVSVSAAPIPSPEGEILGGVVTLVDVTALHELQARYDALLQRLPVEVHPGDEG